MYALSILSQFPGPYPERNTPAHAYRAYLTGSRTGSAQVRALVHLGANACIVGRNEEKTFKMAKDIATCRSGAKVIGIGKVDVRHPESLQAAADRCVNELGGIDFCMYVHILLTSQEAY